MGGNRKARGVNPGDLAMGYRHSPERGGIIKPGV